MRNIIKYILIINLFCLIAVLGHGAIHDFDLWLHLKAGEYILQHKAIPAQDIFSFTVAGKPWIDHEWLFQILVYLINLKFGSDGLVSLQSLIIAFSFLALFLVGYRSTKYYLEAAALLVLAVYASSSRFNIRPDIVSLLFFSLYLYLLTFHIKSKAIWLLVPIEIIWVNFHGYFFLGPLLILFFIVGEFLRRRFKYLPKRWKKEFVLGEETYLNLKRLWVVVILATLINPNWIDGALYPLSVLKDFLSGGNKIFFQYIEELQPTFKASIFLSRFSYFYFITGLCFLVMALNFRRLRIVDILLVTFFSLFSFKARNVAFSAFVYYVIIVYYFSQTIGKASGAIKIRLPSKEKWDLLCQYALILIFIIWIGVELRNALKDAGYDLKYRQPKNILLGIDQARYPKEAVDFVLANKIPSNMFNDFNSGAYLIGRTYPERRVFIDGRTELYGQDFFIRYKNALDGDSRIFEDIAAKYNIEAVFLNIITGSYEIIKYLYRNPQWEMVFFDDSALIFLKNIPENKGFISKHKIDLSKYTPLPADIIDIGLRKVYPFTYMRRASLLTSLKEDRAAMLEAKEALRIMPQCAEAYNILGKVYLRSKQYLPALESFRSASCLAYFNAGLLTDIGSCLIELKENKSAAYSLKAAIRENPRYARAYYELGRLYLQQGDKETARKELAKALKLAAKEKELSKDIEGKLQEIKNK